MKISKKILYTLLTLVVLPSLVPLQAACAESAYSLRVVVEPTLEFDTVGAFRDGLAAVSKDGKHGYIDAAGSVVVPLEYSSIGPFREGLAAVLKDGKLGFIDMTGSVVIPLEYEIKDDVYGLSLLGNRCDFDNGISCLHQNNKWGAIDRAGNTVVPFIYDEGMVFSEGLAPAGIGEKWDEKWGYVDLSGELVIPAEYLWVTGFREGLAFVAVVDSNSEQRVGLIDKTGNVVAPFIYRKFAGYSFEGFSEGLHGVEKDGYWGYIDREGNEVIPFIFRFVGDFNEGLAVAYTGDARGYGYIDISGDFVILYDDLFGTEERINYYGEKFVNGLAIITRGSNTNHGEVYKDIIIDKTGSLVLPSWYERIYDFSEGLARVCETDKWGFINSSGKFAVPMIYDRASEFKNGLALVRRDGKEGFIDRSGKEVIPLIYDRGFIQYDTYGDGFVWTCVVENGIEKWGIMQYSYPAAPSAITVLVDGEDIDFDAYNIDGANYFKLRDLAYTLSGTDAQFDVEWDVDNRAIILTGGRQYTLDGGEMVPGSTGGVRASTITNSRIYLDGEYTHIEAYNINGYNYFKLRDIAQVFGFHLDWDGDTRTIEIDTTRGYSPSA